ncbi:PilZ domain-containing protein [Salidesulfovibrio onnuriiensis]|uniref:PilZ domain-containing protein n=1 Tax=Salidesulfovibrio onnuriiensis TaxID=2583823 RepID=UPI0011C93B09|nr:PilZ domain-containing protein [Salidesulfovibrio onnuriiensis]
MNLEINIPNEDDRQRQAFRTKVPGFNARFEGFSGEFSVKDLSATGFAITDDAGVFKEGVDLLATLMLKEKVFLGKVQVKVMRVVGNGIVGMNFQNIDRRQQIKLDKLVLEVQKRLIALKKAKRAEQDD